MPQIAIHRTVSRLIFFSLSLSSFDETTTELHLHSEKLTETVLHLNLGHFVVFCFLCFLVVWVLGFLFCFFFSPSMRQWQNYFWDTKFKIGGWGTNTKIIKTETLLHLNLEILFYFIFQSSLCLSNACLVYCWLVHYLSLFTSLKLFCLFVLLVYLFFPFSLPSLLSLSLTLPF
jgi:hypothetical protein